MPSLRLRPSWDEFQRLPRHPAYKYDYLDGTALLSPWPRHYHARLDLQTMRHSEDNADHVRLRTVQPNDREALIDLFAASFYLVQPFGSLDEPTLKSAAEQCLRRAFGGGDGPWVEEASFIAEMPGAGRLIGLAFITLLPGGDPTDRESYQWQEPAPAQLWQRGQGQPHLTWILVSPLHKGKGIANRLLAASANVLRQHGYKSLWSTFLVGNESSTLWHWHNGFELIPSQRARGRV
jgi:GNAT superfamily N-acetyltransferase